MNDEDLRKWLREVAAKQEAHGLKILSLEKDCAYMRAETQRVAAAAELTQRACEEVRGSIDQWHAEQKGVREERENEEKRRNKWMTIVIILAPVVGTVGWELIKHAVGWH